MYPYLFLPFPFACEISIVWLYVVMQFGGQHPGGIGVPAVGMAFPGYVGQPNGLGNSEMTWYVLLFVEFFLLKRCLR